MAGTSQFTAQQVLEAGRRAEADGKRDHAMQFYSFVIANHGATAEAAEALDAMRRMEALALGQPRVNGGQARYAPPDYPQAQTTSAGPAGGKRPATMPNDAVNGHGMTQPQSYRMQNPANVQFAGTALEPPRTLAPQPRTQPSLRHDAAGDLRPGRLRKLREREAVASDEVMPNRPVTQRRYRLGRFVASAMGLCGGIGLIAALVALGANGLVWFIKSPGSSALALATSPMLATALALSACVLILLSQVALAVFDMANAVDMARAGASAAHLSNDDGPT